MKRGARAQQPLPILVPGLSRVVPGGLGIGRIHLIEGEPGTGKTVLATQLCFGLARRGHGIVHVTFLTEAHDALVESLASFSYFDASLVGEKVNFVSGYRALEQGLDKLADALRAIIRKHHPSVLVLDTLARAGELARSGLELRRFLRELGTFCSLNDAAILMLEPAANPILQTISDSVWTLRRSAHPLRQVRTFEVEKCRGGSSLGGQHLFDIDVPGGVVVHPRLESYAGWERARGARHRVPFGAVTLDAVLSGGVQEASQTAILGSPGAGKTLLGARFLVEGTRRGERALYFGFGETPERLVAETERGGFSLEEPARAGELEILWSAALERGIDDLAERLLAAARRTKAKRVVVDGIDAMRACVVFPERLAQFFTALTLELRALGATSIFTEELDVFSSRIQTRQRDLSALFDNVFLLRFVELEGELRRSFTVIKMRESDYDSTIHELRFSRGDVELRHTFGRAEDVLRGSARERGARRKRRA